MGISIILRGKLGFYGRSAVRFCRNGIEEEKRKEEKRREEKRKEEKRKEKKRKEKKRKRGLGLSELRSKKGKLDL